MRQVVSIKLTFIREDFPKMKERCGEAEKRICNLEDDVALMKKEIKELSTGNQYLKNKLTDLEERTKDYNLTLTEFPEGAANIINSELDFFSYWHKQPLLYFVLNEHIEFY